MRSNHTLVLDGWLISVFSCMGLLRTSLIAQLVKNPPAMQENPVQFLGGDNPLEEG